MTSALQHPHSTNPAHHRLIKPRHRSSSRKPGALPPSRSVKPAVIQESILIAIPLTATLYRLSQLDLGPIQRQFPLLPALLLAISTLFITGLRHHLQCRHHPIYFKVPFTDQRGYRQLDHADDALSIAVGLPLLVCSALFLGSLFTLPSLQEKQAPATPTHLMDIWNRSPQFSASQATRHLLRFSDAEYLLGLCRARLDLVSFTILNLYALLVDLFLSLLAEALDYLPINNSARLVGSALKSLLIAILFALSVRFQWWGAAISQSMTPFECLFSVFTFQSSLYLTTRLARRAFTLAESCIFSSTSVALMLEVIRLTSARLRYSAYLLKQQQHPTPQPLSDHDRLSFLPTLFRFPTPAIAIQHVLVSGIFLMAFTLAPLLVLSRRLGQRPTKRHRPLARSPSNLKASPTAARTHHPHPIQKPIWTSEPTQPDYYSRFSNPDSQHQSRQYESALKENMRKIIALLIYASISWIGLVVMSHWLGWLFQIGRNKTQFKHKTWWRKILGPGWMAFFCYSFLDISYFDLVDQDPKQIVTEAVIAAANSSQISVRWNRVGMLAHWCICLMIGIGGWTGYLVRKRRSVRNRSVGDNQDTKNLIVGDGIDHCGTSSVGGNAAATSWKSTLSNLFPRHPSGASHDPTAGSAASNSIQVLNSASLTDRSKKVYSNHSIQSPHPQLLESSNQTKRLVNNSQARAHPSASFKLLKLVAQVREFYNYYSRKNNVKEQVENWDSRLDRVKTAESKQAELDDQERQNNGLEGLDRTRSVSASEKNMMLKIHHPQTSSRPSSPALLLPAGLIHSTTGWSVKKEQLNFKRKFFHLLACLMFIPTIPLDVEFSSIAFSVAFVIFTFCEFARYFAFYPIGAGIHLFFNEFIDSKDSGPVILSHFYLLTSCSTGIWLDGLPTSVTSSCRSTISNSFAMALKWIPTGFLKQHHHNRSCFKFLGCKIEDLIGVLVLGIGDSFASVVGNRFGKIKWNRNSSKTVEGSIGFVLSVIFVSFGLVAIGLVQNFSFFKYTTCLVLVSLLEAFTNQNDNLILPLYSWSLLKLFL